MDWPVLVIALIPVAVWILATIFRGVEEAQEKNRPRQPRDGAQVKVPRRPASELDRFLDEARRRRDPSQPPRQDPVAPLPVVVERPPPPKPSPPKPRREDPRPKVVPVTVPRPPVVVVAPIPEPAPPPPRPTVKPRPASPVVTRLGAMLRDKDSLALAFVLREVFDRPVSQRR